MRLHTGTATVNYRRPHAGGDDDTGIPTGGVRRCGSTRHRTRRPAQAHVRRGRALHGRTAAGDRTFVAQPDPALAGANPALTTLSADLVMVNAAAGATVAHSHTWYAGLAGHLAAMLYGIPHVSDGALAGTDAAVEGRTARRRLPGVVLGGAHRGRGGRRRDRRQLRHARGRPRHLSGAGPEPRARRAQRHRHARSGIPAGPPESGSVLARIGVDPTRPIVAFVGRITRQKGVAHLVAAAHRFAPDVQLVLCAGAPDTPEIAAEVGRRGAGTRPFAYRDLLGAGDAAGGSDPRNIVGSNGFRVPVGLRTAGHREPRGDGVLDGGGRLRRRRHSRGGGRRSDRLAGALRPRRHRGASKPGSPKPSTPWSPTRRGPNSTAAPGASGASTSSPGRTSPSRPWRSTGRSPLAERGHA